MNPRTPMLVAAILAALALAGTGPAIAYDNVDARTTWNMVVEGDAELVDTRTLEEAMWVGGPADPTGIPLATIIPWMTVSIAADGNVTSAPNPRFDELFTRTFPNKDQPIVLICRSGGRSARAAAHLESLGYTRIFNLDSPTATGEDDLGVGGFQGRGDDAGYRGYPGRLEDQKPVSWLDSGLPITREIHKAHIPH